MILVDTSVWIDFFNQSTGAAGNELERLIARAEPVSLTGLIIAEVLQGLTRNILEVEQYLSKWTLLEPQGLSTYREAAAIFRLARSRGISIGTIDAVIAALALENHAAVFTLDRDFARVASLAGLPLHKIAGV